MIKHGIDLDSARIRSFCKKWRISGLSVFGSILRDDFGPNSDVDFVAEFDGEAEWDIADMVDMHHELSAILGRRVDILSRRALERSSNWLFRRIVLSELEPVHASG